MTVLNAIGFSPLFGNVSDFSMADAYSFANRVDPFAGLFPSGGMDFVSYLLRLAMNDMFQQPDLSEAFFADYDTRTYPSQTSRTPGRTGAGTQRWEQDDYYYDYDDGYQAQGTNNDGGFQIQTNAGASQNNRNNDIGRFQQYEDMLNSTNFTEAELNNIIAMTNGAYDTNAHQYERTVNLAYDWNFSLQDYTIKNGPLAGRNNNSVKTAEIQNLLGDWNLAELESEFGNEFGNIDKVDNSKRVLTNKTAAVGNNAAWHSTVYHLAEAQRFLDAHKEVEAELQSQGYSDPELEELASRLRHRAGLHYQIAITSQSPIVLDTNGDGIQLTSIANGVQFDIDGDGTLDQVAWTEANGEDTDAWLALPDEQGNITSGKQLFGNQWGDANGYERLKQHDDNNDGVIDANDNIYNQLRLWQDKDHNGQVDDGELKTLAQQGVESISLGYVESDETDRFGNELRQQSTFTRTDDRAQDLANALGISFDQAKTGIAIDAWLRALVG